MIYFVVHFHSEVDTIQSAKEAIYIFTYYFGFRWLAELSYMFWYFAILQRHFLHCFSTHNNWKQQMWNHQIFGHTKNVISNWAKLPLSLHVVPSWAEVTVKSRWLYRPSLWLVCTWTLLHILWVITTTQNHITQGKLSFPLLKWT